VPFLSLPKSKKISIVSPSTILTRIIVKTRQRWIKKNEVSWVNIIYLSFIIPKSEESTSGKNLGDTPMVS
jgi:hypothetical protein